MPRWPECAAGSATVSATRVHAIDLPLSWPGRYSHSPVELLELCDLRDLGRLVLALALPPQ
jgi:putative aminopeptidase FrvX